MKYSDSIFKRQSLTLDTLIAIFTCMVDTGKTMNSVRYPPSRAPSRAMCITRLNRPIKRCFKGGPSMPTDDHCQASD